jgi:hypothetical protein
MSPVKDLNLMLRQTSDGDLTASALMTPVLIGGTPIHGMAIQVNIPSSVTVDSTILLGVEVFGADVSTDCSTSGTLLASKSAIEQDDGEYIIPFVTQLNYVTVQLDITATTLQAPNFGEVQVGVVENVGWPWDR